MRREVIDSGELALVPQAKLKEALRLLERNPEAGKPLTRELAGCRSIRSKAPRIDSFTDSSTTWWKFSPSVADETPRFTSSQRSAYKPTDLSPREATQSDPLLEAQLPVALQKASHLWNRWRGCSGEVMRGSPPPT